MARQERVDSTPGAQSGPSSDPRRAAELIAPVAALRQALIYRTFLDNIEETERIYHRTDPAHWLREAVTAAR